MIRKALTLMLFISFTYSNAQELSDQDQLEQVIRDSFDEVWGTYNADNIEKYYTDDFLLLENGEVWNNDTITNYLNDAIKINKRVKRINKFDFIRIKVTGKTAWISYSFDSNFYRNDKIFRRSAYLESATAILTEKGWRLDMLHSTRIKNELFE